MKFLLKFVHISERTNLNPIRFVSSRPRDSILIVDTPEDQRDIGRDRGRDRYVEIEKAPAQRRNAGAGRD